MLLSDIRVALTVAYLALLFWYVRSAGRFPTGWWHSIVAFVALNIVADLVTRLRDWLVIRRAVRRLSRMDPAIRDEHLRRLWSSGTRKRLAESVMREGEAEVSGAVERFPFARGAKRGATFAFWTCIVLGLCVLMPLITSPGTITRGSAWAAWVMGTIAAIGAAAAKARLRRVETVLEITPYGVTEIRDGSRNTINWNQRLSLRARPFTGRPELWAADPPRCIRLDSGRVGSDRALALVMKYGGFPPPRIDRDDYDDDDVVHITIDES